MSTNGETADMVVRESIQITESAVKLAGLGEKNLAALLVAVAKDNPKLSGKTGLKRLIQNGEELAMRRRFERRWMNVKMGVFMLLSTCRLPAHCESEKSLA